jgi:PadR family transcriptional regulator PadR
MWCMEPGRTEQPLGQLRRGVLEYCVLALLRAEPLYSVDVVHRLAGGYGMKVSEGTLYPMLSRLRREGRVDTFWQESTNGPPRRYYALTEDGQRALAAFMVDWKSFTSSVDALLNGEHRDGEH